MFSVVFVFQFIIVMVNLCVCGACKNSSLSGHRVHRFPNRKKDGAIFRAWVRVVQVKRRDFSSASASENAVVCSVHFRSEDYRPGDMKEFNMGYRSKNRVRLRASAGPSVHASSGSPAGCRREHNINWQTQCKRNETELTVTRYCVCVDRLSVWTSAARA